MEFVVAEPGGEFGVELLDRTVVAKKRLQRHKFALVGRGSELHLALDDAREVGRHAGLVLHRSAQLRDDAGHRGFTFR